MNFWQNQYVPTRAGPGSIASENARDFEVHKARLVTGEAK